MTSFNLRALFDEVTALLDKDKDHPDESNRQRAYEMLKEQYSANSSNFEYLWRLARATYLCMENLSLADNRKRKELSFEAKAYAFDALVLNSDDADVRKWCAITLGSSNDYVGTNEKIKNQHAMKRHIDEALKRRPNDRTLHHLLGQWCYDVAGFSASEKKLASALFSIPLPTYKDALRAFLDAERLEPDSVKDNHLLIALCYEHLQDKAKAKEWLQRADKLPIWMQTRVAVDQEIQRAFGAVRMVVKEAIKVATPIEATAARFQQMKAKAIPVAKAQNISVPVGGWHPKVGDVLENRWEVVKNLSQGAFGAVYEVNDRKGGSSAACKVEHMQAPVHVLKWEVLVMRKLTKAGATHSANFLDCGRIPHGDYVFLCAGMVGQNLEKLRTNLPANAAGRFSLPTCLHIGIETLQAMREVHDCGYLHRDVKPENFAIGRPPDTRRVFVLDLGMVREWRRADGQPHRPRESAPFRGNLKYASVNALKQQEQGRCDDLWAWFYKMIDLTSGNLPWPPLTGADIHEQLKNFAKAKEDINREQGRLTRSAPKEYKEIQSYLMTLRYESDPDYDFIKNAMVQIQQRKGYEPGRKLDWEDGGEYYEQMRMVPYDNRC